MTTQIQSNKKITNYYEIEMVHINFPLNKEILNTILYPLLSEQNAMEYVLAQIHTPAQTNFLILVVFQNEPNKLLFESSFQSFKNKYKSFDYWEKITLNPAEQLGVKKFIDKVLRFVRAKGIKNVQFDYHIL
jgi:hypothetical protein